MNAEPDWNDERREEFREQLRWFIRGEIRLRRRDIEDILNACDEVYIQEECPEDEQPAFKQFAADELKRVVSEWETAQATWPAETDCDRLDRVEAALRRRGILLWQVSPCCDTCTMAEFPSRIDEIDRRHPGFRDVLRGYAFFIDQNMPESLSEGTEISVYLGYGWLSPDNADVAADVYSHHALGIAREVCECLRDAGFEVDWDGKLSNKIGLNINWQRRDWLQ